MPSTTHCSTLFSAGAALFLSLGTVGASESPASAQFRKTIQPILTEFCSDCHADGAKKGNVAFDEFKTDEELFAKRDLWLAALKNVRAGLMPPEKKPKPTAEHIKALEKFIKAEVFDIDPANADPGKVTIRRLNRYEYRNTIRDLTGFDYKVEEELPPDDTGYGFDNIGDVLTISPILMEKYMQAAETITAASVPRVSSIFRERTISEANRRGGNNLGRMSFYDTNKVSNTFRVETAGSYRVLLDIDVFGQFDFDPGIVSVTFKANDKEIFKERLKWDSSKLHKFSFEDSWNPGSVPLVMEVTPITPKEKKKNTLELRVNSLRVQGPLEKEHWARPKNFERFFTKDPPTEPKARREYAREVLKNFAEKAYRRPVDDKTADRLAGFAESIYTLSGKVFEDGIADTITAILASPRFLFRIEQSEPATDPKTHPLVDEYSLATRLSYFLWSTTPDQELYNLAKKGELRKNLGAQVNRLLADSRSDAFTESFVGQWLQVRDVDGIDINAREIIRRDGTVDRDAQKRRERLNELRDIAEDKLTDAQKAEMAQLRQAFGFGRPRPNQVELDRVLRTALREETERTFAYIARGNRSVVELINSDYTFLNERLARHYGITNVTGQEMRLVKLDADSPRGGVLTHGATLIVTSNPDRTSPVKRGLFVLDNILGVPPPPPPPDIPNLEESGDKVSGRTPTTRELLEIHREKPLCSSCHNRMDPLGFALENFNALGMWRDSERGNKVDAAGRLVTGEEFTDIREVKKVLATKFKDDFYRCLTEKLLIYSLGRGLEYYDVEAVDQIVSKLQRDNGSFATLLTGVIDSVPFQKRRHPDFQETLPPAKTSSTKASLH